MSSLFTVDSPPTPATRFQGSKHKLLGWLWTHLRKLPFESCLDAFSGSGCVSHFLKARGKSVTANDLLVSSMLNARALVENDDVRLSEDDLRWIASRQGAVRYDDLISRTFDGIYFTAAENAWLDVVAQNIPRLTSRYKQAMAYHALFQSAMAKRPYNLFHRCNLYMRLAQVQRSFGNKTTWDKPFDEHLRDFAAEANAAVFAGPACRAISGNAGDVTGEFDLVYIDPPYINGRGVGVDYHGFYHFLEGLADYPNWPQKIDPRSKHRRLMPIRSPWTNPAAIAAAFAELFDRHRRSILAVSYRSDGIPSPAELAALLKMAKKHVEVHTLDRRYQYALSTNAKSSEILIVGKD